MEIKIYKAAPLVEPVENVVIRIEEEMPYPVSLGMQRINANIDAEKLEQALFASLPGAIYDALFAKMAIRTSSLFRVAHSIPDQDKV
jgi:F0F1-type ATP synthase membrane subunit a